ncbi:Protein phosphatase 2C 1 [Dinochytrium kinnereticum]|nr:Protein phosphatase 2C 1 [Dinochytrium kinnereticum]
MAAEGSSALIRTALSLPSSSSSNAQKSLSFTEKKSTSHLTAEAQEQQQHTARAIIAEAGSKQTPVSDLLRGSLQIPCSQTPALASTHTIPTPSLPPAPSPSPSPSAGLSNFASVTGYSSPSSIAVNESLTLHHISMASSSSASSMSGGSQSANNGSLSASTIPTRLIYASPATSTTLLDDLDDEDSFTAATVKSRLLGLSANVGTLNKASELTNLKAGYDPFVTMGVKQPVENDTIGEEISNQSTAKSHPTRRASRSRAVVGPRPNDGKTASNEDEDDEDDDDDDDDDDDEEDDEDDEDEDDEGDGVKHGMKSVPGSTNGLTRTGAPKASHGKEINGVVSVEDEIKKNAGFSIGFAEDRNKRYRRTMEDAHSYLYNFGGIDGQGFFAIYDGHAGKGAAEWCGVNLHETFQSLLTENPTTPVPELLNKSFLMTDTQLSQKKSLFSGCTAIVAFIRTEEREEEIVPPLSHTDDQERDVKRKVKRKRRVLYTANVGDARAVLSRGGKALRLSYDHKGSDSQEAQRIVGSGGFMVNNRVNGVLAVTRALGDVTMKEWVIGSPYTTETVLDEHDSLLVLACDGVWDVCTDQEAIEHIEKTNDPQKASEELLAYSLQKYSTDNLSVIVIRLDTAFLNRSEAS